MLTTTVSNIYISGKSPDGLGVALGICVKIARDRVEQQ
jgi:hypothetical protein